MQNFGESGLKNCVVLPFACSKFAPKSIHQIARFQLQKYEIFQLLRGAHPPQTPPCARKRSIGADAPPNHPHPHVEDGSTPLIILLSTL